MATNLQSLTSSYGSWRYATCDCWTQTSLAVRGHGGRTDQARKFKGVISVIFGSQIW